MSKNSKTTLRKSKILFFGGEIGDIGKSITARVAVEQKIAAKREFYLIDADASTPNVGLTYEKAMYEGGCIPFWRKVTKVRNGAITSQNRDEVEASES